MLLEIFSIHISQGNNNNNDDIFLCRLLVCLFFWGQPYKSREERRISGHVRIVICTGKRESMYMCGCGNGGLVDGASAKILLSAEDKNRTGPRRSSSMSNCSESGGRRHSWHWTAELVCVEWMAAKYSVSYTVKEKRGISLLKWSIV